MWPVLEEERDLLGSGTAKGFLPETSTAGTLAPTLWIHDCTIPLYFPIDQDSVA